MSNASPQGFERPYTLNDFDNDVHAKSAYFPSFSPTIEAIEGTVNLALAKGFSDERAAELGHNLLDMVKSAAQRRQ